MKNTIKNIFLVIILLHQTACNKSDFIVPESPRVQAKSLKRGVSYNFQGYPNEEMALLSNGISWFYNWGSTLPSSIDHSAKFYDLLYFPMAWDDVDVNALCKYKSSHPECRYLLAYNEPNLTDQAKMTPRQASEKWPRLLAIAKELDLKIVSPAMNYGTLQNYNDPIVWLDEFFELIDIDDISAISIHSYMGHANALKSYVERFKKYEKPIWMTEFCAWDKNISSPESQMKFMSESVCYMELEPAIERYAWFIPKGDEAVDAYPFMYLITKELPFELTDCGKVYVGMSTLDKNVYAVNGQKIEAEHFTNCNLSSSIGQDDFSIPVHFRPTTDESGKLDIYNFTDEKWVEYQIDLPEERTYQFDIRYLSISDTEMTVYLNNNILNFISLPESDSWDTFTSSVPLTKGKHTVRLHVTQGNTSLNWIKIN